MKRKEHMGERLNTEINLRGIHQKKDKVYWAELMLTAPGTLEYAVQSGYYLGSYLLDGTLMHIVTLGDITSCVVRHLVNNTVFYDEAKAQKDAAERNANRDKE